MNPEEHIVEALARAVCKRIATQTRQRLQKMTGNCLLSGDDTILKNTWEEICVQLQGEQSFAWSTYEQTIELIVSGLVDDLPRHESEAVWMQTDPGIDFSLDNEHGQAPICAADIVTYITREYVYADADNWTNKQIRSYLDRPTD